MFRKYWFYLICLQKISIWWPSPFKKLNLVEVVELDEGGEGEDAHNPHVGQVLQAAAGAPESIESFIEDQAFSPLSD